MHYIRRLNHGARLSDLTCRQVIIDDELVIDLLDCVLVPPREDHLAPFMIPNELLLHHLAGRTRGGGRGAGLVS